MGSMKLLSEERRRIHRERLRASLRLRRCTRGKLGWHSGCEPPGEGARAAVCGHAEIARSLVLRHGRSPRSLNSPAGACTLPRLSRAQSHPSNLLRASISQTQSNTHSRPSHSISRSLDEDHVAAGWEELEFNQCLVGRTLVAALVCGWGRRRGMAARNGIAGAPCPGGPHPLCQPNVRPVGQS